MTQSRQLVWIVPGSIEQLTGGYLYDARIVRGLLESGYDVQVINLGQRRGLVDPVAAARLARRVARCRWDAVVIDELAYPAMAIGLPLLRLQRSRRRAPVVALIHHLRGSEPGPPLPRRLARIVERVALSCVDAAVCTSFTTAASVRPLLSPTAPIHVVKPGANLHHPYPERERGGPASGPGWPGRLAHARGTTDDERRSALDIARRSLRVLMVAHWTRRKRVLDVLRALELTSREVTLDLVGDPDRDLSYARRVRGALGRPALAGRVRVHGRVPSERLAALYEQADALVLASTHEGYGMVLAEAVAAGLPIVATRVGAVPEVVRDGCEAELVAPGDPGALARALERLLSDPAERCRRASLARERAASLPRWEESCARFADVLETVIGGRRL